MGTVVDRKDAVRAGRSKGDQLAAQGLADAPTFVLEANEPDAVDLANLVAWRVLDRRQRRGKRSRTWPVALSRGRHAERLMWPLVIVERTPAVEGALAVGKIAEATPIEHFGLEGAMEALLLALGLRMTRSAMQYAD